MLRPRKNKLYDVRRYVSDEVPYKALLIQKFGQRYLDYRKNWEKAGSGKLITEFPLHIDIDTIDKCNLRCNHCQEENTRIRTNRKISSELVKKIFCEAQKYNLCAVNIGAVGEPLLEKNILLNMLDLADDAGIMEKYVHTNGLLLDNKLSKRLVDSSLTFLCISVDASNSKTYRKARGGDFSLLKNNIEEFAAIRNIAKRTFPLLRLSFLMLKGNYRERRTFIDAWGEIADIIDYQPLINYDRKYDEDVEIKARCYSPFSRLMVGTCGQLGACCCGIAFNKDMIIGDLNKQSIFQAWNSQKMNKLRTALLKMRLNDYPTCNDCLRRREIGQVK